MHFWLIAIWRTIPRRWVVVALPILIPFVLFAGWWLFGGLFQKPIDPKLLAARAELKQVLLVAQKGDRAAQLRVGVIYRDGLTGKVDGAEAARWFGEAMKRGDGEAQLALGELYARGLGVRQDFARAAELFRSAAGFGRSVQAQYLLGDLYAHGRGVSQDYLTAIDLFRKAALGGHAGAQSFLGSMYENGFGVDKDPIEAFVWYSLAAEQAAAAMSYRADIDPRAALEKLKAGMTRLQVRDAERLLTETRRKISRPVG